MKTGGMSATIPPAAVDTSGKRTSGNLDRQQSQLIAALKEQGLYLIEATDRIDTAAGCFNVSKIKLNFSCFVASFPLINAGITASRRWIFFTSRPRTK